MDLWFTGSGSDWAKKENMINVCTNNDFSNLVKKRLAVDLESLLQTRDNYSQHILMIIFTEILKILFILGYQNQWYNKK